MNKMQFLLFRFRAIVVKEVIESARDYITLIAFIINPILLIWLFGVMDNTPRYLPTAVLSADHSPFVRTFVNGLVNTRYFKVVKEISSEQEAENLLQKGEVTFVLNVPSTYSHDLITGNRPKLLLDADGTNPITIINAVYAANEMTRTIYNNDNNTVSYLATTSSPPLDLQIRSKFNPTANPQYFGIPTFISFSMMFVMAMTTLTSITREYDRGTMESLLITPVTPLEIILGKMTPFLILSYVQFTFGLLLARWYFHLPIQGSLILLYVLFLPFALGQLAVGILISTLSKSQFQAVQLASIYFLPNIVFTGFALPFEGMQKWGQWIGNMLPATHFTRILVNIMLKDAGFLAIWQNLLAILLFALVICTLAIKLYRPTLD